MTWRQTRRGGWLAIAALVLTASTGSALAAGRVVGGRPIRIQAAPWAVLVTEQLTREVIVCSGSIIDARHVLTAAHCVYNEQGGRAAPSQLSVEAGVSSVSAPLATDAEQQRAVRMVRVHPRYVWALHSAADDVAVLTLATPLDLRGATARAVALPRAGTPIPPGGTTVGLAGFGRQAPAGDAGGGLVWMTAATDPQGSCGNPASTGVIANNATILCAASRTAAACNGDSGAGLVTRGSRPTLIGVVSGSASGCAAGGHTFYSYLGAGEIDDFVRGDAEPPAAPRESAATFINLTWQPPLVLGTTLTCSSGHWVGTSHLDYAFITAAGRVLQRGSEKRYVIGSAAAGTALSCEVAAVGPGGTTVEETRLTSPAGPTPPLTLAPVAPLQASPGNPLIVRVSFHAPRGLEGRFGACVTPPAAVGHRACNSLPDQHGGSGSFVLVLSFRVLPTAPLGTSLLTVSAAAGAAAAQEHVAVRIARAPG
jgi:hypothetical protein